MRVSARQGNAAKGVEESFLSARSKIERGHLRMLRWLQAVMLGAPPRGE